jgi:phosphotriesterase-related protein
MVEAGFAGNLLLGMDVTRERLPSYGGTPGLAFLSESFLPRLEECLGLDLGSRASAGEAVEAMMVANPARVLPLRR